ncbi:AraC family transcriptional regulator [Kibdelosporangium persicum]|uniref:HTH-type transcriptional regulator AlkR n=1 Tax=Kibdelosporangium persicum TaxID=2698649 RepID=A0ABX2F1J7_9PSEU|nr:AraC family transcriptional regulator [Kibdelosporangium persicum]NRN64753.1 HTH-type transcriptional regulator AlkR [Kibdelosporangium persicum]
MLDDLLQGVRAHGASFVRKELTSPWSTEKASLTLLAPVQGEVRIAGRRVRAGDTAVVREQEVAYPAGPAVLLVGTYPVRGAVAQRLMDILPGVLVVPDSEGCDSTWQFLETQCGPGQQVVQDRLLDWLLVCTLRSWFDGQGDVPPGWRDETVGPVLRAMHAAPGKPWTLAALADQAGVSRTTLASRFAKVVGKPPLTYLTDWRMTVAADLLAESDATVGAVAHRVGYADAFGFSAAFKRFHGISPSECRRTCRV